MCDMGAKMTKAEVMDLRVKLVAGIFSKNDVDFVVNKKPSKVLITFELGASNHTEQICLNDSEEDFALILRKVQDAC